MRSMRGRVGDAAVYAVAVLVLAACPALARRVYAPGFATAEGVARHVLVRWVVTFAAFHWLNPRVKARAQRWELATAELTDQLGRRPTPEEYFENWRRTQASWKAAGRPL